MIGAWLMCLMSVFFLYRVYLISHLMANESVELIVTPEVPESSGVEIRRHSTGKSSSGTSVEKIVPNYLRASTGSCHDFCKYGRKHAFELKERRAIPNRATRKQLHHSSEDSVGGTMMSVTRLSASVDCKPTKMSKVKLKGSVDSKTWISDTSNTYKQELPTKLFDSQKERGNEVLVNRNKSSLAKVKPSLLLKSHTSPSTRQEISFPSKATSKKVGTSSRSTSRKVEALSKSTPNKMETLLRSTANKEGNPSKSTSKVKTSSKSTSNMAKISSQLSSLKGKEMKLSEKRVTSLNPSSARRKQISSMNSSEGVVGQRYSKIKMEKGATSSKATALSSPRLSLRRVASISSRKLKSLKIASHLKNQLTARKVEHEEHSNNEIEEKTLYVINMESENKTLQSDQNATYDDESYLPQLSSPKFSVSSISQSLSQGDQEESEYTTSEFEQDSFSGNHEIECMENEETLEVEKEGKPKKDGVVYSKDKDNQMIKLKFRRGKVVENHTEISSPRRLKFRRAKVPGVKANVKGDARKSFKGSDEALDDSNGAPTGPEKVFLRHQDMQDKKDAQGLLNNVIEETASKLVEARKSKVKALVGAFETVISLQEKNPSADTLS
ncbi:micronuclear linker histone polyprotein isoform X1 [Spatholobus suberectus]|nr:micronuclear linker histone polyprotein isoform X1 [Spatholobus suberectus]